MAEEVSGPGEVDASDVGRYTVATTEVLDTRKTMAYAASINDVNPAYFDDLRPGGVAVHPCICFSLQWASRFRPDQELNLRAARFGVHASTDLRLVRPFRAGEAITTQGQMVAKRQLRPGVYNVDRYRFVASDGELVAELDYNGITRGATLRGGPASVAPEPQWPALSHAPDGALWEESVHIPLHAGQQYTECAQIYNPIHTEPSVAQAAGLPGVILHGSATKALATTAVIDRCFDGDPTRVTRLCGQLRGMVLMDTTITVVGVAEQVVGSEKHVFFSVRNQAGEPAISNGVVCGRLS